MSAILRPKEAAEYLSVSRTTLYRWAATTNFPKPIKLGAHASGWRKADLDAWIEARGDRGGAHD